MNGVTEKQWEQAREEAKSNVPYVMKDYGLDLSDYEEYANKIECYEKEQKKKVPLIRDNIQKIVDAMRTDLGSNLDKESTIYDFVQCCRKHE